MEELLKVTLLQKQNEEIAQKKIEEAYTKLQTIKKQCSEAKIEHDHLQTEIQKFKLKKLALNELICSKKEHETNVKKDCEQIAKEIDDISWRSKIVAVKREIEESKREYYKDLMKTFNAEVPTFMDVDEHKRRQEHKKKLEKLQNEINELKENITQQQNSFAEREKMYLDAQKLQKIQMEKLKSLKKSIENVENLILNQEEEFKKLSIK